jgi:hypothetical protein
MGEHRMVDAETEASIRLLDVARRVVQVRKMCDLQIASYK